MKAARYAVSRQKSCLPCSAAKAKCDRMRGRCTRCTQRNLPCSYSGRVPADVANNNLGANNDAYATDSVTTTNASFASGQLLPVPEPELLTASSAHTSASSTLTDEDHIAQDLRTGQTSLPFGASDRPDFSDPALSIDSQLFCPINAEEISNRWLHAYIPVPGQKVKNYSPSISAFIYRILNSYAAVTARGHGVPPFVHTSQLAATSTSSPLSTCLTLIRMCEKPLPGSESTAVDVLQREMSELYEKHETYDESTLLGAFQAYLIYSMALFFKLGQGSNSFLRQAMMNLQHLACSSSRRGLVCTAEQQRIRPIWEAWIVAEAKRRTLFTMYLFDSVLSAHDGLPTMLGSELHGLPAPGASFVWKAQARHEWESAYNTHLADWMEDFRIDELWPIPEGFDEAAISERRLRVDQWLESVDEYGTMMYAVTSCTHGG